MLTRSYGDYQASMGALCGMTVNSSVGTSQLTTDIAESWRISFNSGVQQAWDYFPWLEICPKGEARFVGNKMTYGNNLAETSVWTATALTITKNSIRNPLDARTTASKLLETAASSAHSAAHSAIEVVPSTQYTYSAYVRPNGRSWVYLNLNDGDLAHNCFFNVTTGALGTATNCTAQMQSVGSGFYLVALQFTTSTSISATTSALTVQVSTDGSTLSYAGDTAKGLYVWGVCVQQTTNTGLQDNLLPYEQTGEFVIETPFQIWQDSPYNTTLPRELGYDLNQEGIQIIGTNVLSLAIVNSAGVTITSPQPNPVFVYYRKKLPIWEGSLYDATDTYAVDEQVYFTTSAGVLNYYKCISAASAGDTPETDTDKWEILEIPRTFYESVVWWAYADWLTSDGQGDKAVAAMANAERKLNDAMERESRQMARDPLPLRVNSHQTSQSRQLSYV